MPAVLLACHAGGRSALRSDRRAVGRAHRGTGNGARADRARRHDGSRGRVRRAARHGRRTCGMSLHGSATPLTRTVAILQKELLDMVRDRRTAMVTLMSSIAAGPLLLLLIFNLIASQAERARELTLPVAGAEYAPALIAFLERQE